MDPAKAALAFPFGPEPLQHHGTGIACVPADIPAACAKIWIAFHRALPVIWRGGTRPTTGISPCDLRSSAGYAVRNITGPLSGTRQPVSMTAVFWFLPVMRTSAPCEAPYLDKSKRYIVAAFTP